MNFGRSGSLSRECYWTRNYCNSTSHSDCAVDSSSKACLDYGMAVRQLLLSSSYVMVDFVMDNN